MYGLASTAERLEQLRAQHYNARLVERIDLHADLTILRVVPEGKATRPVAGQYTVLGLGQWEPRVADCDLEPAAEQGGENMIRRAYSYSCSMLDAAGRVRGPAEFPYLEFSIALVRHSAGAPPALTPRLFALSPGDRLFLGPKSTGHYTLAPVRPEDNVVFAATGTGEAPHNAMLAELLARGHRGRIAAVTCVRYRRDLGYAAAHAVLMERYSTYKYLTLTTREPENLRAKVIAHQRPKYLQDYFASGDFERESGIELNPEQTHIFLCGNPAMIGIGATDRERPGMLQVLAQRGFRADELKSPGNIHFEKYW